jgi:hypothetical protein
VASAAPFICFKLATLLGILASFAAAASTLAPASAQPPKPNVLFIMGNDIGWMQPSMLD